jgi:hypothetical protein
MGVVVVFAVGCVVVSRRILFVGDVADLVLAADRFEDRNCKKLINFKF